MILNDLTIGQRFRFTEAGHLLIAQVIPNPEDWLLGDLVLVSTVLHQYKVSPVGKIEPSHVFYFKDYEVCLL